MFEKKRAVTASFGIAAILAVLLSTLYLVGAPPFARSGGVGQMDVLVHDAPNANVSNVWVTITSVSVHASNVSGSGWTQLHTSAMVNLAKMNGTLMAKTIGLLTLPAGSYEMIRLTISNVSFETTSGLEANATVMGPTADIHGNFAVASGSTTYVSIDIDLASSLHVMVLANGDVMATFTPNIGGVSIS